MFDMSWGEIMVIGGVALIVIGPKDLPRALRTVGQMTTKVRRMAGEFQSQFSEAMREAELDDVRKEVEGLNRDVSTATSSAFNPLQTIRDEIKGAVEARPATGLGTTYGADGQPSIAGDPVSGDPLSIDPVPAGSSALDPLPEPSVAPDHLYPATAELTPIVPLDPEALPLVPLPVDEPVLPAATPSGPEIAATQEARA